MKPQKTHIHVNEFANRYDDYIADKQWIGPELIFKSLEPFLKQEQKLLDLGIGTGMASIRFANAGIIVSGMDCSEEMLKICEAKKTTDKLYLGDLASEDCPWPDENFDFIISNAFFHFIPHPGKIFENTGNHLKTSGYFCFTTLKSGIGNDLEYFETETPGITSWKNPENGLFIYKHSEEFIENLLKTNNLEFISKTSFLGFKDETEGKQVYFELFLAKKKNS
ncbi:MAG: methyltransferase domain-containing protein [Bacteroidales bacterium]